jgi:hypothetical protein
MRMWLVNPLILCRRHLLGEHLEHHMFIGSFRKHINIDGYINNNLLEPLLLVQRHNALVIEMKNRGYDHRSPISSDFNITKYIKNLDHLNYKINRKSAFIDLISRCINCRKRYEWYVNNNYMPLVEEVSHLLCLKQV